MTRLQTLLKNVTVVRPDVPGAEDGEQLDLGISDGRFVRVERDIPAEEADVVIDGRGLLVGPDIKSGMPIRIDRPQELGADRLVNAIAARSMGVAVTVFSSGSTIPSPRPPLKRWARLKPRLRTGVFRPTPWPKPSPAGSW